METSGKFFLFIYYPKFHRWILHQDIIAEDEECHGTMFVPIVLGSDKTTVSVATGHTEFYPLYLSPGNIHNSARRSHQNGVALLGFLAIPKGLSLSIPWYSITRVYWWCKFSKIPATTFSQLTRTYSFIPPALHVTTTGDKMSWWSFPTRHLRLGSLHCRLSWAGTTRLHCSRLVCSVCSPLCLQWRMAISWSWLDVLPHLMILINQVSIDHINIQILYFMCVLSKSSGKSTELWETYWCVMQFLSTICWELIQSFVSHLWLHFLEPTFMNFSHQIFSIKLSKAPSRITSSSGLNSTSNMRIQTLRHSGSGGYWSTVHCLP